MGVRSVIPRTAAGLTLVIGLVLLSACVSNDLEPELVRTAPVSFHESFEQMSFKVLPPKKQVRLEINQEDPQFGFDKGVSHYEALALPDMAQPYVLRIDSEVVKTRTYFNGKIFFPVLTFLDGDKKWIKTYDALPYVTQKPWDGGNYMTVSIQISDQLAAARYVVIHTQPDKLNMSIGRDGGKVLMQSSGFTTMMTAPSSEPRYRYEFASSGWVRIQASEEFSRPSTDTSSAPLRY